MPTGQPVRPFLLEGHLPDKPTHFDEFIRFRWLADFIDTFHEIQRRLDRLHYKSLGAIVALQEQIGAVAERRYHGTDGTDGTNDAVFRRTT